MNFSIYNKEPVKKGAVPLLPGRAGKLFVCGILFSLLAGTTAWSHEDDDDNTLVLPDVPVVAERVKVSGSQRSVKNEEITPLAVRSTTDLLRAVPGLLITQHTGGAKAHQIFLRGFDAEHGQDVAGYLDGIPLNETSHIHGRGYLDLHFLIPSVIQKIEVVKGPYNPRYGNFSTAGAIDFIPRTAMGGNFSAIGQGGSFESFRLTAEGGGQSAGKKPVNSGYFTADAETTAGYTDPGSMQALRTFGIWTHAHGAHRWRLLSAAVALDSESADIVSAESVNSGQVDRFGAVDQSGKVEGLRHIGGLRYTYSGKDMRQVVSVWHQLKKTDIFSNFTFFNRNSDRGDQTRQLDERQFAGLDWEGKWGHEWFVKTEHKAGVQLRHDSVDQSYGYSEKRNVFNRVAELDFGETNIGGWASENFLLTKWLRLIAGLRGDVIVYDGTGFQDKVERDVVTNTNVTRQNQAVVLDQTATSFGPRASVVLLPSEDVEIYVSYGESFTSQEARLMSEEGQSSLTKSRSAEISLVWHFFSKKLQLTNSYWGAFKEEEILFDAETGLSLPAGASRRLGADLEARLRLNHHLSTGQNLYLVQPEFENGEPIPNQANVLWSGWLTYEKWAGFFITGRTRFLGARQLDLDLTAESYFLLDAAIGYKADWWSLQLSVDNVLGTEWLDSAFAYESRSRPDAPKFSGLHYTPGQPRTFSIRAQCQF